MEKIIINQNNTETSTPITSKVTLDNRNMFNVTGVTKVVSTNECVIELLVGSTKMFIGGTNLHIDKLDTESGIVSGDGTIDYIRYNGKKPNFLKRMFK